MSNASVGGAYHAIIEEVVNSSRGDFEDLGVEESVLEALRKGWQQKLSALRVAKFPWDPEPEPQPAQVAQPPPPQPAAPAPQQSQPQQQAQYAQAPLVTQASPVSQAPSHITLPPIPHANGMRIKQEPGLEVNSQHEDSKIKPEPMAHNFPAGANTAQQRATALLQQNFGQRASASINAINSGMAQPQLHQQQQASQRPGQGQPNPNAYHQSMIANAQQRMQQIQKPHPNQQMGQHHVDGTADIATEDAPVGVLLKNGAELGRVEIDRMLHKQLLANAKSMEGGGLMVSLKEVPQGTTKAKMAEMGVSSKKTPVARGQFDGNMDEDEEDEDAINSELDDPDENSGSDDEDDDGNNVILCVYDKVQRVKNKWKCVLKDGLLTVNGRDYVFHKATGEYEW